MNCQKKSILIYSILIFVLYYCEIVVSHHEECSKILWESKDSNNETDVVFKGDTEIIFKLLPLTISFSQPVESIETEFLHVKSISPESWVVSHRNENDENLLPKQLSLALSSETKSIEISKLKSKDGTELHCVDHDSWKMICGIRGELDLSPDNILIQKAAWGSGRNYQLKIPSYPTFVGFAVDLFFDGPVTGIEVAPGRAKAVEISPTHWILASDYTDSACVKLIDIFFTISYVEKRNIVSILLNGKAVLGTGKSAAVLQNQNFDAATNPNCETFFTNHVDPWYSSQGEKARSLWFTAVINSQRQIGLVVDFIFEQNIEKITLWELKAEKLEEHHWKATNPGIIVSPNETVRFPLHIYFYDHYYVKIAGIKVNDQIICGLGAKSGVIVEEKSIPEATKIVKQSMTLETFYSYLMISVIMIAVAILFSVVVFALILIRKMKETLGKRRHLYDFPAKQQPTNTETGENNYASINDSVSTVDTSVM